MYANNLDKSHSLLCCLYFKSIQAAWCILLKYFKLEISFLSCISPVFGKIYFSKLLFIKILVK